MDGLPGRQSLRLISFQFLFFFPRLKQLSVEPYSQEEAERAAGMGHCGLTFSNGRTFRWWPSLPARGDQIVKTNSEMVIKLSVTH